ncbi:hypothetical protein E2C01_032260 [Portunus trituberculatus]|uniref:Uncharacterized protein n=1 Tax=Portunus trituberculatus TaxID=210409 RepID=A0A5B7EZV1_PORTR|nr:hypothetical protein [Portunus trituberculatus]
MLLVFRRCAGAGVRGGEGGRCAEKRFGCGEGCGRRDAGGEVRAARSASSLPLGGSKGFKVWQQIFPTLTVLPRPAYKQPAGRTQGHATNTPSSSPSLVHAGNNLDEKHRAKCSE